MIRALLYLRFTSLRNLLVTRARRLRQPKYFIGFLVGAVYFWGVLVRPLFTTAPHRRHLPPLAFHSDVTPTLLAAGAFLFTVILALSWIMPGAPRGLVFSEAEIAFLFPSPVTRRRLVHYKLVSSQLAILFTSLFFSLISQRWSFLGGNVLTHAIGWWFVLSIANLHFNAAALTLLRIASRSRPLERLRAFSLAVLGIIALAGIAWLGRAPVPPAATASGSDLLRYLDATLATAPLPWLLWPAKAALHPFLAASAGEFLRALPAALLVLAVHYVWVLRIDAPFEEASLLQAQRRSARAAALREGGPRSRLRRLKPRLGPFALASRGRPEVAFLWKNLLSTRPYFRPRVALVLAGVLTALCLWLERQPDYAPFRLALLASAGIFGGYTWLIGPQLARQDLRSDLGNADIFKTYPLRGWQIVLGELLTPLAILTVIVWLALLVAALCLPRGSLPWLTPGLHLAATLAFAALVPLLCAVQLVIPTGATLLFPAWFHATRGVAAARGIEVLGQRLIFVAGQLLMVLTVIVPVAVLGGGLGFLVWHAVGPFAGLITGTVLGAAVLVGELVVGLYFLGERFERFDLSAELRP